MHRAGITVSQVSALSLSYLGPKCCTLMLPLERLPPCPWVRNPLLRYIYFSLLYLLLASLRPRSYPIASALANSAPRLSTNVKALRLSAWIELRVSLARCLLAPSSASCI